MATNIVASLAFGCLALGAGVSFSDQAGPATVVVSGAGQVQTFARTPDGDWETTIVAADGTERSFRYTPPNKIDPQVQVVLRLDDGPGRLRTQYRYRISNGANGSHALAGLFVRGLLPSALLQAPEGWGLLEPPTPGNLTLLGPTAGIEPGTSGELMIESAGLPGVITIQTHGATPQGLSIRVPEGLSEQQRRDLDTLTTNVLVGVPAIGPAISAGMGEPEVTFDIVLVRILSHYESQLQRFQHPGAAAVARLAATIGGGRGQSLDDPSLREALTELRQVASAPVAEPWHRELSAGFALCLDIALSGRLRLAGMPP